MALVNGSVPSLINGVSQQPASIRLPSQCELQENGFSSLSEGLIKRPPTTHVAFLLNGPIERPFCHFIDRDTEEKYLVMVFDGEVKIFTLDGTEVHVEVVGAAEDYLITDNPSKDLKALTLADTTVIVNRSITTAMDADLTDEKDHIAIYWVRAGSYNTRYRASAGASTSQYVTDVADSNTIKVYVIAEELFNDFVADLGGAWDVSLNENFIAVQKDDGTHFKASAFDSAGNNNIKVISREVQRFSDLPDVAVNGMVVHVVGEAESEADDYWVNFETQDAGTFNPGVWVETVAPEITYKFDAATMPHVLVRLQDDALGTVTGTAFEIYFELRPADWSERAVGDTETNPDPSFIGRNIEDVFLYRNRLGFLADTSVVLSKAGDFFNFFRGTARSVLDDDPIDVEATHPRVVKLRHAVVFNQECTIFGDRAQFILKGGDTLTPSSVNLTLATEYECEADCKPIGLGKAIFFPYRTGPFSNLSEYFDDQTTETGKNAVSITAHVPKYIEEPVARMTGTTAPEMLFVLSDGLDEGGYVYQWYWNAQDKVQSAWSKWTFGSGIEVEAAEFIGSRLYLVIKRAGALVYLEYLDVSVGQLDPDDSTYLTHLDRRITEAGLVIGYDSVLDQSTVTLPYSTEDDLVCVSRQGLDLDSLPGHIYPTLSAVGVVLTVKGKCQGDQFYIDKPYTFRYRFSPFYLRSQSVTGGIVAVDEGRLQIQTAAITAEDTGYFKVEVTPRNRDTSTYEVPARKLAGLGSDLDAVSLADGTFKFVVLSKNDQVTIDLINDSFLPSRFVKVEWTGLYHTNTRRL